MDDETREQVQQALDAPEVETTKVFRWVRDNHPDLVSTSSQQWQRHRKGDCCGWG